MGVYPLLADETCRLLAIDFDKHTWRRDAAVLLATCRARSVPAALERSRSGRGGHVWIFFTDPVPALWARRLGAWLLTESMERNPDIGFESYDRLFPSQDTMPAGGFGNLIALPSTGRANRATAYSWTTSSSPADQWGTCRRSRMAAGGRLDRRSRAARARARRTPAGGGGRGQRRTLPSPIRCRRPSRSCWAIRCTSIEAGCLPPWSTSSRLPAGPTPWCWCIDGNSSTSGSRGWAASSIFVPMRSVGSVEASARRPVSSTSPSYRVSSRGRRVSPRVGGQLRGGGAPLQGSVRPRLVRDGDPQGRASPDHLHAMRAGFGSASTPVGRRPSARSAIG